MSSTPRVVWMDQLLHPQSLSVRLWPWTGAGALCDAPRLPRIALMSGRDTPPPFPREVNHDHN